jgi:hypothetical protein
LWLLPLFYYAFFIVTYKLDIFHHQIKFLEIRVLLTHHAVSSTVLALRK